MKRILLFPLFFISIAYANTINIDWFVDGSSYNQSSCEYGGDLNIPPAPEKYGYDFVGWDSSAYTPISYLRSTGTQYIDTGFTFDDNIKVLFKANWGNRTIGPYPVFGNGNNNSLGGTSVTLMGKWYDSSVKLVSNTDYTIEMQLYKGDAYTKINDVLVAQNTRTDTNDFHVYLFAYFYSGTITKDTVRFYYFQMYQNDILVRDLIPVIDSNGVPCMWDKASKQFFYNQGTGDFIAGPTI